MSGGGRKQPMAQPSALQEELANMAVSAFAEFAAQCKPSVNADGKQRKYLSLPRSSSSSRSSRSSSRSRSESGYTDSYSYGGSYDSSSSCSSDSGSSGGDCGGGSDAGCY
jgi:hypothetical protein